MFKTVPLTESSYVQKAKKVLPYSVTPIKDIQAYRIERKAIEAHWEKDYIARQAVTRQSVHEAVANQSSQLSFTAAEQAEINYRKTRADDYTFEYKPAHTPGKWHKDNEAAKKVIDLDLEFYPPEPLSIIQRFKNMCSKLMRSGFGW